MAMASASSWKRNSGATGPKVSSLAKRIFCVTPVTTVGWKKVPPSACGWPPVAICAPLISASSIWLCTFATASLSISGPWVVPSWLPSPTFSCSTATTSFSASRS
ncbi:Uncharacterised protein [Acinetobacter baumannii]|nr:Uncharacterised protein [Acinetobacter baumannii]